jgi:hypothetical protein
MKVIGLAENGDYISIVSHTELEKCSGKYYGNLPKLKVGASFDIGAGYNFTSDIKSACSGMADAVKNFSRAQASMTEFAVMVSKLPDVPDIAAEGGAT